MKKKKHTRAISAAPVAIPPNPKTAAMMATMKNARDQLSMGVSFPYRRGYVRRDPGQVAAKRKAFHSRRPCHPGDGTSYITGLRGRSEEHTSELQSRGLIT